MAEGSVAIKVRRILIENGVDKQLADALALAFDEVYHSQMADVATKQDLKLLIELMEKRFALIDKRFEDINKRFEDINKRFEAIDKRFEELLHYVDKRFEDMNKRFEDMNKRFEDLNKRITTTQWLIFLLFTIYTGLMAFFMRYLVLSVT
ncbi:MAG: hypothetical protein GXO48_01985 [Chlorobi bacterium]|nr:hypothetical protein [Chlorobiota bacterium]